MRYLLIMLFITSCHSADYYHSDAYKIKQRQDQSMKMFHETHAVRKRCSSKRKQPRRSKRRNAYYN